MTNNMIGRDLIVQAFDEAQRSQSAALMPYFSLGYPNRNESLDIIDYLESRRVAGC